MTNSHDLNIYLRQGKNSLLCSGAPPHLGTLIIPSSGLLPSSIHLFSPPSALSSPRPLASSIMPYTSPNSASSAGDTVVLSMPIQTGSSSPTSTRNHRRSFTDEHGPGAFAALTGLPKRRSHAVITNPTPAPAAAQTQLGGRYAFPSKLETANIVAKANAGPSTPVKSPKFQLRGSEEDDESDDSSDDNHHHHHNTKLTQTPTPPNESNDDNSNATQIPFPTLLSPTATRHSPPPLLTNVNRSSSSPQIHSPIVHSPSTENLLPPSIYRSPHLSGPRNDPPSTRKSGPLKPALKTNHSSPHLPSLAHGRALTQSAPSAPNLAKAAWLSSGGSSPPGSGASTPSSAIPTTPKSVHFASEKSSLESVVLFTKSARPRSLSNPLEPDTETETERETGSNGGWGDWGGRGGGYPFPSMPQPEGVITLDGMSPIPAESAIGANGFGPTVPGVDAREKRMVYLETLNLPPTRPPTIRGSVLVRNLAFQKRVAVRFTLDDWQTTSEVSSTFSASLASLPPPFFSSASSGSSSFTSGHSRAATVSGGVPAPAPTPDRWDRFSFTIKLEDMERSLSSKKIFLVVRYTLPSQWGWESGGEWWDNNDGKNYEAGFKLVIPPAPKKNVAGMSSRVAGQESAGKEKSFEEKPTGLAARTAASLNASSPEKETSTSVNDSYAFPPLPPPGPIRLSSASPSLSLKNQMKPHLLLPLPVTNTMPKLRSGREATFSFGSKGSPPASPTTYTPPVPGEVPRSPIGRRVGGSLENLPQFGAAKGGPGGHSLEDLTSYGKRANFTFTPSNNNNKPTSSMRPPGGGLTITTKLASSPPAPLLPPFGSAAPTSVVQQSPNSMDSAEEEEVVKKEEAPLPVLPPITTSPNRSPTTIITGKKRGLSLSNYCSPTSPSLLKSPTSHGAGVPSMQSLIPSLSPQRDGSGKTSEVKGESPITPLGEFRIVGGMPATFVDEASLGVPQRPGGVNGHLNRVGSWSSGGWIGMPDVVAAVGRQRDVSPPELKQNDKSVSPTAPPKVDLHAQELSGDSTLSTPDLERSPEQKAASTTSTEDDEEEDEDAVDELDRKLKLTAAERRVRDAHEEDTSGSRSDDSTSTQMPESSSLVPFPSSSPTDTRPPLSNFGRRVSSATGVQMTLDMSSMPKFKEPSAGKSSQVPVSTSPPRKASPTKSYARLQPAATTGLGLNVTSPSAGLSPSGTTNGPPPEFLAKYCFFVSSPSTSPPEGGPLSGAARRLSPPSSNTSSPTDSGYTSPVVPGAYGIGVDTPKASSPGLAGPGAWWGSGKSEKSGVSAGSI
ncbi:hypothetical protein FRB93_012863 [Tulasnella sp. JGI-2019a]|nr:hypothetical protein FRB93_012863 [Tulasnella sp. JGI-2019a]